MKLFRVVLTGGPCGGKSSSLVSLKDTLRRKGYRVMTMPEIPTILMSNGAQFPGNSLDSNNVSRLSVVDIYTSRVETLSIYSNVLRGNSVLVETPIVISLY
jgi:nucleoside-triphosphatase THEP1